MILHTVNKSPFEQHTLADCLRRVAPGDAVLLIENGVHGAVRASPVAEAMRQLHKGGSAFFMLLADVRARGLQRKHLLSFIEPVDDHGFVELAARADKIQSWY